MKLAIAAILVILSGLGLWFFLSSPEPESAVSEFPAPIAGAFGVTLGQHFEPDMVAKVQSEEQKTYTVKDRGELQGRLIQVKPNKPSEHFQEYVVKTTGEGIIYAVEGKYKDAEMTTKECKAAVRSRIVDGHYLTEARNETG